MNRNFVAVIRKKLSVAGAAIPLLLAVLIAFPGAGEVRAAQPAAPPKVQATVKSVDAAQGLLTTKMEKKLTIFSLTPQTKITTAAGEPLTLTDLKKGDEIKVAWLDNAGKPVATEIAVILPASFKEQGKGQGKGGGKGQGKNNG